MQSVELSASNLAWSHSLDGVEILKVMVEDLDQQQNNCPHEENLNKNGCIETRQLEYSRDKDAA